MARKTRSLAGLCVSDVPDIRSIFASATVSYTHLDVYKRQEYHKDVKILFFHTFSEASKFEVLLSYLFIWKHLISVASAWEILYNHG